VVGHSKDRFGFTGLLLMPFVQSAGELFRLTAHGDKDQCGAMAADQLIQSFHYGGPDRGIGQIAELRQRRENRQVHLFRHAAVDDGHRTRHKLFLFRIPDSAAEESGHSGQRPLGGGQADALRIPTAQSTQPFQRQAEMHAAFIAAQAMDFVHDDILEPAKEFAAFQRRQQQGEGFRRGDENMWRFA